MICTILKSLQFLRFHLSHFFFFLGIFTQNNGGWEIKRKKKQFNSLLIKCPGRPASLVVAVSCRCCYDYPALCVPGVILAFLLWKMFMSRFTYFPWLPADKASVQLKYLYEHCWIQLALFRHTKENSWHFQVTIV